MIIRNNTYDLIYISRSLDYHPVRDYNYPTNVDNNRNPYYTAHSIVLVMFKK